MLVGSVLLGLGPGVYNLPAAVFCSSALRIGGSSPLLLLPRRDELLEIKDERRARLSSVLGGWEAVLCFKRDLGCCCVLISVPEVRNLMLPPLLLSCFCLAKMMHL